MAGAANGLNRRADPARPRIQWEQATMRDLEDAFGPRLIGRKEDGKFKSLELGSLLRELQQNPLSPICIVQSRFDHPNLRAAFLQAIGVPAAQIAVIPPFGAFQPDIVLVTTPLDDEIEILPNGDTQVIQPGDGRKALAAAIARHLNAIEMPNTGRYLRGLAWLFPPEEILGEEEKTLANPITYLKAVIKRDLRLPVPRCLTVFNVAEFINARSSS